MLDSTAAKEWRKRATRWFRSGLTTLGSVLPMGAKLPLATRSTKLGYLLVGDGDFVYPRYLGDLRVRINTRYTPERVMLTGRYEPDLWWVIENLVSPGETCIDIGANAGAVTLFLAKRVGAKGRVLSFEPGPIFFERLAHNLSLNPQLTDHVELHNVGVSDKPGSLKWAEDAEFPGNAFLFGTRGVEVPVITLDSLLMESLNRLDFIKIDVEGMEREVLQGGAQVIDKFRPKIFLETLMDFERIRKEPIRQQATQFLIDRGYDLYRVSDNRMIPVQYPHLSENTLAIPRALH